jgi:glycosyltransferase involved in cell wall biosynthesis
MISIVVPLYNEEESIETFYLELSSAMAKLKRQYEVIFVDDGSTDTSLKKLQLLEKNDKKIRVYSFRKNKGKAEALTLGFQQSKGDYIVTLDADLQDKPNQIQKLFKKFHEGYDLVCGWRKERNDPLPKILSSKFFNFIARSFWGLSLHDYNCGLKAYTREAAQSLNMYGGMHRFIPLLVYQQGFLVTEVPILHEQRRFGKSKYGFSKLWKDLPDIFTMIFLSKYSNRPLHFFGTIGGVLFVTGFIILTYLSIIHFLGESIGRRPLLFLGMLLIIAGFQVFFTGFLADLLINVSSKSATQEELLRSVKYPVEK